MQQKLLLVNHSENCATSQIWKTLPNMFFFPDLGEKNGGVLSMRMQVILDSSFAHPGSAPIWGGKKGEFREWTRSSLSRGQDQLNFDLLKANVIDEVTVPLDEPRVIPWKTLTRSHETPAPKPWKRPKKPNDTEWSSTNASSIPTLSCRTPTATKNRSPS